MAISPITVQDAYTYLSPFDTNTNRVVGDIGDQTLLKVNGTPTELPLQKLAEMMADHAHFSIRVERGLYAKSVISLNSIEISTPVANPIDEKKSSAVILLDAGHGGRDPGTIGSKTRVQEKEITLAIVRKIEAYLKAQNITVRLTRETDESMPTADRRRMVRQLSAKLLVSIHCNSSPQPSARGIETYYLYEEGRTLAQTLHQSLVAGTGSPNRGIHQEEFMVLCHAFTATPAALLEVGFLSNPREEALLQSDAYQNKIAQAIAQGIVKYVEGN